MSESTVAPEFEGRYLRDVFGHFPTSVVAVTTIDDQDIPVGMVVGSFLVDKGSSTLPKILETGRFCANALAGDQESVCRQMSKKGVDRFAGLDWQRSVTGNPILDGVVAWVDCVIDKTVELGDHHLVVGAVHELTVASPKSPLLFFRGAFGEHTSVTR
jgi:flavin reductase (DIM6/NTAB) family NADH-FMN oxidoreductase RutF